MTHRRFDVKAILKNPVLRQELHDGAVDFICKVESIRPSFETKGGEAAFKANRDEGLPAALRCIANMWAIEINGQPRTEFIGGLHNAIEALNEIALDIEQAIKHTSEGD